MKTVITILLEGGLIKDITANHDNVEVNIVDHDEDAKEEFHVQRNVKPDHIEQEDVIAIRKYDPEYPI